MGYSNADIMLRKTNKRYYSKLRNVEELFLENLSATRQRFYSSFIFKGIAYIKKNFDAIHIRITYISNIHTYLKSARE